jgi:hypothetical protein
MILLECGDIEAALPLSAASARRGRTAYCAGADLRLARFRWATHTGRWLRPRTINASICAARGLFTIDPVPMEKPQLQRIVVPAVNTH